MKKMFWIFLIPLLVLLLGGPASNFIYDKIQPQKQLVFYKQTSITPEIGGEKFYIVLIEIINETVDVQEGVSLIFSAPDSTSTLEVFTSRNYEDVIKIDFRRQGENTIAEIGRLRVREKVNIQLVSRSPSIVNMNLRVVSDSEIGESRGAEVDFDLPMFIYYLLLFIFLAVFWYIVYFLFRNRFSLNVSTNDTAFSLIHMGDAETAKKMLEASLMRSGGSVFEVSNLGVCYSLLGQLEEASRLIDAATLLSNDENHHNVLLAKAILAWKSEKPIVAKEYYDRFSEVRYFYFYSPKKRYSRSKLIKELEEFISAGSAV